MNTKVIYERPKELNLLTNEQLDKLHQQDIEKQAKYNKEYDPDWNLDSFTRKWYSRMSDARGDWRMLQWININDLYEVIYWLSVPDEPRNPKCGRPGKIKELARDIKYAMSPKQRAIAYKIITKRFEEGAEYYYEIYTGRKK